MKRKVVVSMADAVAIVRDRVRQRNTSVSLPVVEQEALELWWAWVVPVQSVEFVTTGDPRRIVIGLGPYLVDKFTGEVIPTGSGTRLHQLERERGYRSWWDFRGPNWIMKLPWPKPR